MVRLYREKKRKKEEERKLENEKLKTEIAAEDRSIIALKQELALIAGRALQLQYHSS
jgi:hypothetical protein